ncbi:MFS transporter [Metallumcola ferriviriculae]|uniref:MFS transporter n=1 Tax=Metallumcola ferriviriculae TaxID=3039180 RepID=UPI0034584C75
MNNKASATKQYSTENTIWSRTFILILGIALLGMMGGSLLGPVLPALVSPFGIIDEQVGMVLAVYTASTALSMSFVGPLIDKLGRKQVVPP